MEKVLYIFTDYDDEITHHNLKKVLSTFIGYNDEYIHHNLIKEEKEWFFLIAKISWDLSEN